MPLSPFEKATILGKFLSEKISFGLLKKNIKKMFSWGRGGTASCASFTLVELLIVIGILAVLTAAVVIAINPAELLKQARDTTRMQDLASIDKALSVLEATDPSASFGTANTVYVSIADNASSTCGSLGLPTLPTGWSYHCTSSSTLQNVDGNGWIPVNFASSATLAFSTLPLDPTNTTSTGNYYTYTTGGSWELTALMESDKHDAAIYDGGMYPGVYQAGSHIDLTPGLRDNGLVGYWDFNEGSGTTAYDRSGNGNNGTLSGNSTWSLSCKVGDSCISFPNSSYVSISDSNVLDITNNLTILMWIKGSSLDPSITSHPIAKWEWTTDANFVMYYCGNSCGFGNVYRMYSNNGGVWRQMGVGSPTIQSGDWNFVGLVYNNLGQLYWNGSPYGPTGGAGSLATNAYPVKIQNDAPSGSSVYIIDDVRIYNRALSAAEIKAIYDATK